MMMFSLSSPGLTNKDTLCGYEYKSRIADDSTLLLSALWVSSMYLLHTLVFSR